MSAYYQANMMQACPEFLPKLRKGQERLFINQQRSMYVDCALRHNKLIKTIKEQKNAK
jgi:hypothetical protein